MKKYFYNLSIFLSRRLGVWFFRTFSWFIATGYFFLFPGRVKESLKFYRALFPGRSILYQFYCVWKQYHNFTGVYVHRFIPKAGEMAEFIKEGWAYLDRAVDDKSGLILIMSHVGNWELAAQKLIGRGSPVMLYLGAKHKEEIERIQKEKLSATGIKIVATDDKEKSPFALLPGINFLREGGIVSMTGDRLWGEQTFVTVDFLGYEVRLPDTPHLFALMTGVPLMTFFVYQDSSGTYHIKVSQGRRVLSASRADRKRAVQESAQIYADDLARFASEHPFEWYHFEPFLGEKINKSGTDQ